MDLCKSDSKCKTRFKAKSLSDTLQGLVEQLDNKLNSTCAELVCRTAFALRSVLDDALMDAYL
ncbi:hypothetical protein P3T76_006113 [Phytophthora citrophthora]|uniref:Uncharacterized protein n=1 Tax=Phytophthora citrophthora TaxID=4793 RepID=A0AAD9GPK7_9STRA|nr:hypothetical protein P3T76_006113 [Phytophthora citrophthora]